MRTFTPQRKKTERSAPWLTPAKFQLGEMVYCDFLIQDRHDQRNGQIFRDYGQVTGLFWSAGRCRWTYCIKWTECNSYPESAGITDEVGEEELKSLRESTKQVKAKIVSVVELFEDFSEFKSKRLERRTLSKYQALGTRLAQFFGNKLVDSVIVAQAEAFIEFLRKFQQPCTVHDRLIILNACWDWGMKTGRVSLNPWCELQIKVAPKQRPKPFTRDEIAAILQAFSTGSYTSYKPYVEFLFLTGTRTAEAIGLRWGHVSDDFRSIWIGESVSRGQRKSTKTNRDRTFPCNTRLAQFLEALKPANAQPDDLIFPAPKGGAMDDQNFCKRVWKPMLELAGVVYRRPYTTRHSFISHCLAAGMAPTEVAAITGHDVQTLYRCYAGVISSRPRVPEFM